MSRSKLIYQFRVTLREVDPPIWRRILVSSNYSFWDLHVAIQDSMGWLDYHLHEFQVKKPRGRKLTVIGLPDTETDHSVLPGWEVSISEYFTEPGVLAAYDYDFGDGWHHEVLLEGILIRDTSVDYPLCVAGARACPPEDCGGIQGYERLLKVLTAPGTEKYKDMAAWLKNHAKNYFPYKPDHFDPSGVKFMSPSKRLRMALGEHE